MLTQQQDILVLLKELLSISLESNYDTNTITVRLFLDDEEISTANAPLRTEQINYLELKLGIE